MYKSLIALLMLVTITVSGFAQTNQQKQIPLSATAALIINATEGTVLPLSATFNQDDLEAMRTVVVSSKNSIEFLKAHTISQNDSIVSRDSQISTIMSFVRSLGKMQTIQEVQKAVDEIINQYFALIIQKNNPNQQGPQQR